MRYPFDLAKAARAAAPRPAGRPDPTGSLQKNGKRLDLADHRTTAATRRGAARSCRCRRCCARRHRSRGQTLHREPAVRADGGMGGILQNGKYDLAWDGWVAGIDPDNSSMFLCSARPPNGNNTAFYCKAEMDAAQDVALTHFAIPVRKAAYETIEALLARDQPVIPVWWPRQIQPINPDFQGLHTQSGHRIVERLPVGNLEPDSRLALDPRDQVAARHDHRTRPHARATTSSRAASAATTTSTSSGCSPIRTSCAGSRGCSRRSSPSCGPNSSREPNSAALSSRPRSRR